MVDYHGGLSTVAICWLLDSFWLGQIEVSQSMSGGEFFSRPRDGIIGPRAKRACCTKWENPMENPPSNRFFLQFGFSDHGYTTANPRNRLLYKLETDDEALDVRRSSFSDPFNAHDSGFMMDPSLFAIPAPWWTIAGFFGHDECLRRVGDLSWDHPSSGRGWLAAANSCTAGGQADPPEETGFRKSHEECDRGTRWNQHMEYNNSMYIYTVYIYITYLWILYDWTQATSCIGSWLFSQTTHTHMHALRVDGQIFTIGGFAESLNLRQTIRVPLWSHDVSWELPWQSDVAPGSPADPRWRSPVSTRLGALWNVVHSTMLGRFTVKLPSDYLT